MRNIIGKMTVDWENLYKVRLSNASIKHDVVKLILVRKILDKYKRKDWIHIYTEFELEEVGLKPDVYFENTKDKSIIIYEIQKEYNKAWLERKTKEYQEYSVPYFNSIDFVPIPLEECPEKINEISKWLEKYTF